jgi:hypothetical protein
MNAPDTRYDDACRAAATDQGLDPLRAALDAAGIRHELEQTGGFCMTVGVYRHDLRYLWATEVGVYEPDREYRYLVCEYDEQTGEQLDTLADGVTTDQAVGVIDAWLTRGPEPAELAEVERDDATLDPHDGFKVGGLYSTDDLRAFAAETGATVIGLDDDDEVEPAWVTCSWCAGVGCKTCGGTGREYLVACELCDEGTCTEFDMICDACAARIGREARRNARREQ